MHCSTVWHSFENIRGIYMYIYILILISIYCPGPWEQNWTLWQHPGPRFNKKIMSYQYRKSHCGDKTILRPSYPHNGISYTGKMTPLYWIRAQFHCSPANPSPLLHTVHIAYCLADVKLQHWSNLGLSIGTPYLTLSDDGYAVSDVSI